MFWRADGRQMSAVQKMSEEFTLRLRRLYTHCGIVLVAINPYQDLQIYGTDTISMYRGKGWTMMLI